MTESLGTFLVIDYALLALFSWLAIDHLDLQQLAQPIRIYQPIVSDLFASENILLYMVLAGTVAIGWAGRQGEEHGVPPVTRHLSALFAVLAVPVRLMTDRHGEYDTAFFAFVFFFSALMLYALGRSLLTGLSAPGLKDVASVAVLLAIGFWMTEPWSSPSAKLEQAIGKGDAARFGTLARRYPDHLRLHTGLFDKALRRPERGIIERIIEAGHTTVSTGVGERAIFQPQYLGILEFLHARGVDLTSDGLLREATRLSARSEPAETVGSYPVLAWLIRIRRDAPAGRRESADRLFRDGWQNPVAIAAAAGNADLMRFLVGQGFTVDEEVFQALVRNQHENDPDIRMLLTNSGFVFPVAPGTMASTGASLPMPVPSRDGLDLILWSGEDVQGHRERQNNIFHYLAQEWRARDPGNARDGMDYERLFTVALSRKIDLEAKNRDGLTPLWVAVHVNNFRAATRLLEAGADPDARDPDGMTMRDFCLKNDRRLLADLVGGQGKRKD